MSDGLTVKERIALLKQKSGANEGSSAPKPEPKRTVGKINSPFANRGGDVKNEPTKTESQVPAASCASNATSIAERIAAMKVSGGEIFQSTGDSSSGNNNVTMASDEPPVSGDESAHKNISVAEKIAALKSQSATPPPAPQQSVSMSTDSEKFHPPIVPTAVNTTGAASESDDAKPTPEKRGSIADRIAAMQSFGSSSKPQGQSVPAPAADVTSTPTARKGSIADKIAALKASSAAKCAESQGTPPGSGGTGPAPKSSRRLSGDRVAFAAGINLAGFNPNSPRPPFALPGMMSPKPVGGGRSGDGDGGASERMDEDEDADGVADHRSRSSTESSMKHVRLGTAPPAH